MGEYFIVANLSKHEFINLINLFNSGIKRNAIKWSGPPTGISTALVLLVMSREGAHSLTSHWCGDRIAIVGDYGEFPLLVVNGESNYPPSLVYEMCAYSDWGKGPAWTDITEQVEEMLKLEFGEEAVKDALSGG